MVAYVAPLCTVMFSSKSNRIWHHLAETSESFAVQNWALDSRSLERTALSWISFPSSYSSCSSHKFWIFWMFLMDTDRMLGGLQIQRLAPKCFLCFAQIRTDLRNAQRWQHMAPLSVVLLCSPYISTFSSQVLEFWSRKWNAEASLRLLRRRRCRILCRSKHQCHQCCLDTRILCSIIIWPNAIWNIRPNPIPTPWHWLCILPIFFKRLFHQPRGFSQSY